MLPISALNSSATSGALAKLSAATGVELPTRVISPKEMEGLPAAAKAIPNVTASVPSGSQSFERSLGDLVSAVSGKQSASAEAVHGLLAGEGVSLHQAMIAMEEANVSFQLMVEVRNKLLESYQELMRMQI
jgi:flagellar hook-basal body complex protein FliE